MFPILLFSFIAIPVIEIALFIQVGSFLGVWTTVLLVLLTAVIGASLVRSQGLRTLLTVQQRLNQGEVPAQQILEGVLLAVAGILLFTPGFLTDFMGMVILLPYPRARLAAYLMKKVVVKTQGGSGFQFYSEQHFGSDAQDGHTYDGEYEKKDDDDHRRLH